MEWNTLLCDKKHDFVSEYGKELLEFMTERNKQVFLELGCGTGTLTAELARLGNKVIGADSSKNMIDKAKEQFGNMEMTICLSSKNKRLLENAIIIFLNLLDHIFLKCVAF